MHSISPGPAVGARHETNSSLLVETSLNGDTWNALGLWTSPTEPRSPDDDDDDDDDSADECTAMVTAGADSEHVARCALCTIRDERLTRDSPVGLSAVLAFCIVVFFCVFCTSRLSRFDVAVCR